MTIDELQEKLDNPQPGDTFTPSEVQQLIDWHVNLEVSSAYTQARIADSLSQSTILRDSIANSVQTLIDAFRPVQTPQWEVIVDDPSQGTE